MSEENIEYEVKWMKPGKTDAESRTYTSQVLAENKALKLSMEFEIVQLGEWQLNINGTNKDHLIMRKEASNGEFSEPVFPAKDGDIIERDSKKKLAQEELDVPEFLKRKKSDPPRKLPAVEAEPPTPSKKKKAKEEVLETETNEEGTTDMTAKASKKVVARKGAVKAVAKAAAKAKPVAKKARAAVTPSAKKEPKRVAANWAQKAPNGTLAKAVEDVKLREGTLKEKVFTFLYNNKGKPVTKESIAKAGYGSASEQNVGALPNVLRGIGNAFTEYKLPMQIVGGTNDKEFCYGIFAK